MNKKILLFAVLLMLAATIAAGFYLDKNRSSTTGSKSEVVEKEEFAIKDNVVETTFPKAFPEDMYVEPGSELIEVRESETNDGRIQSFVNFTTKKTLVKAVSDYVGFFESKNWVEIEALYSSSPERVTAVMQYQNDRLTISSQLNAETGEKTVRIDLTQVSVNK